MSVRLIVVALLAAAVTTVAADDTTTAATEKVVKTTMCEGDVLNADKCECSAPLTRTFPTVCPKEAGEDNLFWKADSCADDAAAFVVKGYKTNACTAGGLTVSSTCKPAVYSKAECDDGKKVVTLYGGCNADSCSDCKESVTFTISQPECRPWGGKFIKMADGADCTASGTKITFTDHGDDHTCANVGTELKIKKECTATRYYGKATCTGGKASFQSCPPKAEGAASECTEETCTTVEVKLGSYEKKLDGETLFLDKCPAPAADVTFQVYAGVMEYKKTCAGSAETGYANATCTDADVLSIKTCSDSAAECTCDASANTKKYTVGVCTVSDDKAWMVDSCESNALKQYSDKDCTMEIFAPKKGCSAVSYYRAECGSSGDNTVKLYAGCNTDKCDKGDGDNGCKGPTTFTSTSDTASCKKAGTKYYMLTEGQCNGESASAVTFMQYNERNHDNTCKGKGTPVAVPVQCTATGYQKVTCTATDGKATIEECPRKGCDSDCKPVIEVPLKDYKQTTGGSYLYIDSCPTGAEDPVIFQVYADVKKYQLGCHGHTEATCGEKTTTTTTETTTEATTSSTSSGSDSDGARTTSTDDNTSNNSSGLDDGSSLAPAHSVGVLALVLCLLACAY